MKVRPPRLDARHPDYRLECQEAIDVAVRELVDTSIVAGWKPEAVYQALAYVVESQRIAYSQDPDPADDPLPA